MNVFAEKNSMIPNDWTQIISTGYDYQRIVTIEIFKGECTQAEENKSLGSFDLILENPKPKGISEIKVQFFLDSNGFLTVTAKQEKNKNSMVIAILEG